MQFLFKYNTLSIKKFVTVWKKGTRQKSQINIKKKFFECVYVWITWSFKFKLGFTYIIEFFPNGIFTSVGKYSNSVVELPVKKVDLGK